MRRLELLRRWLPITIALIGATLLMPVASANACSCVSIGEACQNFFQVDSVFVGRVVSIDDLVQADQPGGQTGLPRHKRVQIEVAETFRGDVSVGRITVFTGQGGGDCGYPFKMDGAYMVYAHRDRTSNELTVAICSRTRPLNEADEDLAFARSIKSDSISGGTVRGQVRNRDVQVTRANGRTDYAPLSGIRVRVQCDGLTRDVTTDEEGRYEIAGVPIGTCRSNVSAPSPFYVAGSFPEAFAISGNGGCAAVDTVLAYDGRISGRLVDPNGAAISGVSVIALSDATNPRQAPKGSAARTDDRGVFEMSRTPPGSYLLAVNLVPPEEAYLGWPTVFYPGTEDRGVATRIDVRVGERVDAGDFILPSTLRFARVSGLVVDSSGRPVPSANLRVKSPGRSRPLDGFLPMITDGDGRFSFAIPEKTALEIDVWIPAPGGQSILRGNSGAFTASAATPGLTVILR
ncbi:MAG TPA: carboxypeptidase regulatory-like domain-containing protein [Vicinamibacterales bacterium]